MWKKLLDTKDLIAYEKSLKNAKIRLEARLKNNRWRVYKTYNPVVRDIDAKESISQVKEYIAASRDEAQLLLNDLQHEDDSVSVKSNLGMKMLKLDMRRCYKEEFVEKWKFTIDDFSEDNFVVARFDAEIKLDVILHERYNPLEKQILEKLISSLGLKEISNRIKYDFYYFKRHSAKCRVYEKPGDKEMLARLEFSLDQVNNASNTDNDS